MPLKCICICSNIVHSVFDECVREWNMRWPTYHAMHNNGCCMWLSDQNAYNNVMWSLKYNASGVSHNVETWPILSP